MITIHKDCITSPSDPEFTVKDEASSVIFENPEHREIRRIKVDGCVFKVADGERCDFLIIVKMHPTISGNDFSIFVELKGSDIDKAFRQLAATQIKMADYVRRHKVWIISYSGNPRFRTSDQNLILKAIRDHGARLFVKPSPYRHILR